MTTSKQRAAALAEKLWSGANTVGIVQRTRTRGFMVGRAFLDGRRSEILGQSMVDWESAFANAEVRHHGE